jgi:ribosomal protein L37AE/L43A
MKIHCDFCGRRLKTMWYNSSFGGSGLWLCSDCKNRYRGSPQGRLLSDKIFEIRFSKWMLGKDGAYYKQ